MKSKEYYKSLLADLYFTVSAVLDSPLEDSVNNFSKVLQEYTAQISKQVSERIHISSRLSIPENLSELFKTLEFETEDAELTGLVSLEKRGDGIQARHIPIILKYIADEDQKTRNQGSMKVATIWGFEEPENGVELSKAFEMANDFEEFSQDIQMFITTHSPAFYMKNNDKDVQVIYVTQGEKTEGSKLKYDYSAANVGQFMGLMPIVAPYIAEQEEKIARSKKILEENMFIDITTIMVEGKTDKQYLELAIKLYSEKLYKKLQDETLRVFSKEGEGGCKKLIELAYAWIYSGNTSKAIVLFDKDKAGISAKNELVESTIYRNKRSTAAIQVKFLEPSDTIIDLYKKRIDIYYEIEHLLSTKCWLKLKEKDFVEPREYEELSGAVMKVLTREKTINAVLDDYIKNSDIRDTIVTFNPHKDKKDRIYNYVESCKKDEQIEYLSGFKKTIELLEKIIG